jgi:hypothetical protein
VGPHAYEITFVGQAGRTLRADFDDCEVTIGPGTATLRAELPDRGALTGLMERISGLGLDVIDVSLAASPPGDEPAAESPVRGDDIPPWPGRLGAMIAAVPPGRRK